tara:strand:+ start:3011 stop:3898 length:888 start_codon:yes stop_codon:yes gene_type:complete
MYYRRKVLLALLQAFEGKLEKITLQKLLFLFTRMQEKQSFYFVPYKFGCFSYQANADLFTMAKYGHVIEKENNWIMTCSTDFISLLKDREKEILKSIKQVYSRFNSKNELIRYTYLKYPYFAINSNLAQKLLTKKEYISVKKQYPKHKKTALFTIGYEGASLEEYLNKLIQNDIKVLCDVRKNPLSMKYGFSKKQLKNATNNLGILYLHFPEFGIESNKRQNLKTQQDYDKLLKKYKKQKLPKTKFSQEKILKLMRGHKRTALTCFEADIRRCHRTYVAEAITDLPDWKYELIHI